MKVFTIESVQNAFEDFGVLATCKERKLTPQNVIYYIDLHDLTQLQKAKRLLPNLELLFGQKLALEENGTLSHLKLIFEREKRGFCHVKRFGEILQKNKFNLPLGVDENGELVAEKMESLTHLLIAGTTGSGKSVLLNSIIMGLACYNTPKNLVLVLIDTKKVEFSKYADLPHLATDILTEPNEIEVFFNYLIDEMEQRYLYLAELGKAKNNGEFKKIIVVIDELADLILLNKNIKMQLVKLLQKARACGIHFIIATQSPRAKILDGLLLANLPSRVALTCASTRESILILGHGGAEKLLGLGDCILKTANSIKEKRLQAPFINDEDIKKLIN